MDGYIVIQSGPRYVVINENDKKHTHDGKVFNNKNTAEDHANKLTENMEIEFRNNIKNKEGLIKYLYNEYQGSNYNNPWEVKEIKLSIKDIFGIEV